MKRTMSDGFRVLALVMGTVVASVTLAGVTAGTVRGGNVAPQERPGDRECRIAREPDVRSGDAAGQVPVVFVAAVCEAVEER